MAHTLPTHHPLAYLWWSTNQHGLMIPTATTRAPAATAGCRCSRSSLSVPLACWFAALNPLMPHRSIHILSFCRFWEFHITPTPHIETGCGAAAAPVSRFCRPLALQSNSPLKMKINNRRSTHYECEFSCCQQPTAAQLFGPCVWHLLTAVRAREWTRCAHG